jgi:peptide/nickel transport system substrate-binding protein
MTTDRKTQQAQEAITRRAVLAGGMAIAGTIALGRAVAQTPVASPEASPVASPQASPAASPMATPAPDHLLAIFHAGDLPDDGRPRRGGTLRLPVRRLGLTDFALPIQRQDPQVTWSYLDALVRIDPETGTPAPSLARQWSWSDDSLALTFDLRRGVTWHDGTPFTAEDVHFSHITYRDDYRSVVAGQTALVDDVVVIDDSRVEVRFAEPDGAWLFNVASLPIFPAHQYREAWEANLVGERTLDGIAFGENLPVGTGPWAIASIDPSGAAFTRNEDYFADPPHAARLELLPVDSMDERVALWRGGDLHGIGHLDPQRVEQLLDEEGRLMVSDLPRSLFAALNFNNAARLDPTMLVDMALREAISLAINRERYAEEIWGGFLRHERQGLIMHRWVETGDTRNPRRDVERARELLADAGYVDFNGDGILDSPAGDALVLTTIVQDTVEPAVLDTLEAMDIDLREAGIAMNIEVLPQDAFVARWSNERTWDLIVYDLTLHPAFAEFDLVGSSWDVAANAAGWNPGGYWNPAVDEALAAYFAAVDEEGMAAALADLQRGLIEDPFAIWLGQPQTLTLLGHDVRGFVPNPLWPTLDTRLMWLADEG